MFFRLPKLRSESQKPLSYCFPGFFLILSLILADDNGLVRMPNVLGRLDTYYVTYTYFWKCELFSDIDTSR